MPCYTVRENPIRVTEQPLDATQAEILKSALKEMGFAVRQIGNQINFSGTNKLTGRYESGSHINGVLKSTETLDVNQVKQSYAAQMVVHAYGKKGWSVGKKTVREVKQ